MNYKLLFLLLIFLFSISFSSALLGKPRYITANVNQTIDQTITYINGTNITYLNTSNQTGYTILEVGRSGLSSLFIAIPDTGTGSSGDNNYTTGISITGTTTKNITLSRNGMGNISATFTDIDTDTDTYLNSVTATNGSTHLFNFSVNGQTPIYVSIEDLATNNSYYLASNPSNFISNTTMNKTVWCGDIIGGSDGDFCVDATGGVGGGGNTTEEMQDAIGNSVGSGLEYNDTANWLNHSDTSSQASSDNSGNTFIQDITLDTFGHLTSLITASVDFAAYATLTYINSYYYNTTQADAQNLSINNWATSTFATISSLANYVRWDAIYTHIYNKTEVNAINTSVNNHITQNNQSVNNNIINTNNTMKLYADAQDTAFNDSNNNYIATKVSKSGDNMTGLLNMTADSNISISRGGGLCGDSQQTYCIKFNGTTWII